MYNFPMPTVASSEFRRNASKLLDRVERGEIVQIQRHGKVVAQLSPAIQNPRAPAWKQPFTPLKIGGKSGAEMIFEDREPRV